MWLQFAPTKAGPGRGTLEQVPWAALPGSRQRDSHPFIPCPATPGRSPALLLASDTGQRTLGAAKTETSPAEGKARGRDGGTQGSSCRRGHGRVPSPPLRRPPRAKPRHAGAAPGRLPRPGRAGPGSRIPGPPSPPRGRRPQRRLPGLVLPGPAGQGDRRAPASPRPPTLPPVRCPCFPGEALPAKAGDLLRVTWEPPKQSQPTSHTSEK